MTEQNEYSHDLETLKESVRHNNSSRQIVQWLLFAIVAIVAVAASFWLLEPLPGNQSELVYNEGISEAELPESQVWIGEATEKALNSYLNVGGGVHVLNKATSSAQPVVRSNADWVVKGRLVGNPNTQSAITLVIDLISTKNTDRRFTAEIAGTPTGLNDLSARASAQVYAWLGKQPLSGEELVQAALELPPTQEAQELYAEGLEALEKYDGRRAVTLLEEAVRVGGDHPVVLSYLASAWGILGYTQEAQKTSVRAFNTSQALSREKQLEIEAQYRTSLEDWGRAVEIYNALKEYHPNDVYYRIQTSEILLTQGQHDQVWDSIQELRSLPLPMRNDPRIDLIEARYWHQKGNYSKSAEIADDAVVRARQTGEKSILAAALLEAIYSDSPNKRAYLTEAESLISRLENPRYQSAILAEIAKQHRYDADLEASETNYRFGLEISENVGDEVQTSVLWQGLAITLDVRGALSAGYELKKNVMEFEASRGNRGRESIMMENIGISLFKLGRLQAAEQSFEDALIIFREIEDTIGIAWAPYHLSRIRSRAGDLTIAHELALTALENSVDNPEGDLELNARYEVAEILMHKGELAEALIKAEQLEKDFAEISNQLSAAESMIIQARLHIRLGGLELAEDKLESALQIYQDADAGYYQLEAMIVADDLYYLSSGERYIDSCLSLEDLSTKTEFAVTAFRSRLRVVRCKAMLKTLPLFAAVEQLDQIKKEARELGLFEPLLEAEIIKASLGQRAGNEGLASRAQNSAKTLAAENGWSLKGWLPVE